MAHPGACRPPADLIKQHQAIIGTQRASQDSDCLRQQRNRPIVSSSTPSNVASATKTAPTPTNATSMTTAASASASSAASSKSASAAPRSSSASELVRPHYRGHQRRQSVARLLPDISKLRLLSWLVEASNELINCDIAIMDGVYAKLNRSRESLLFWQQSQQQQQQAAGGGLVSRSPPPPPAVQPVANKTVISRRQEQQQLAANKSTNTNTNATQAATTQKHHYHHQRNKLFSNHNHHHQPHKLSSEAATIDESASIAGGRSHHSLPLTNYDSSSLAAISMRSSLSSSTNKTTNDTDSLPTTSASESIAASIMLMMKQNSQQKRQQQQRHSATGSAASQPTPGARNNCSLPIRLSAGATTTSAGTEQADYCDDSNQSDDEDDDNSSAASSTTSSGIHGASSSASSSAASSTSSSGSSSVESSCSFDGLSASAVLVRHGHANSAGRAGASSGLANRASQVATSGKHAAAASATAAAATTTTTTTTTTPNGASSAEQLSERIRRAVMEHNYLQNLLVNVIRQHDRQRDRLELELSQPQSLDAYGRSALGGSSGLDEQQQQHQLPRIDLASIACALDDGCQCSCHHSSFRHASSGWSETPSPPQSLAKSTHTGGNNRASTLPTSSSLSLFQPINLVPSRKNRRKKHSEPSREDLIKKLSDKLCENCFETHYWLHSCVAIETPIELQQQQQQQQQASSDLNAGGTSLSTANPHDHQSTTPGGSGPTASSLSSSGPSSSKATAANSDLDSIVALRNATFIRLVQQQVRATISNSIELIDLIRREIKSPESIKQRQLMRCFSASIQLLSSVASYVVPSQDISTFITTDMVPGHGNKFGSKMTAANNINSTAHGNQQATGALFNLPPSDFDHILLYPHHHHHQQQQQQHSTAGLGEPFLSNHHQNRSYHPSNHHQNHHHQQQQYQEQQATANNYHLAQAPEIPIRRRHNQQQHQQRQRRSFDETCNHDVLQQHPRVHLLSRDQQSASGSFRSLPPDVTAANCLSAGKQAAEMESIRSQFNQAKCQLKSYSLADPSTTGGCMGATSDFATANTNPNGGVESSSGASSNNSSASSSIARGQFQQSSLKAQTNSSAILDGKPTSHDLNSSSTFGAGTNMLHHHYNQNPRHGPPSTFGNDDLSLFQTGRTKFWHSSKFNFIKKLLQVKQQRLLRQQSKDRRIYNNKVANKFRLVMMDLIHFNKSQQLLTTENGVNSLLTSMRNVLEFGLYLTVKLY